MRLAIFTLLALSSSGFAQRSLNPIGNGNVLRPGIPLTGAPGFRGSIAGRVGARVGRRSGVGVGGALLVPYPVDGFSSGYSGYSVHNPPPGSYDPIFGGYTPAYSAQFGGEQQQQPTAPTVVINQNFQTDTVRPQFRDYSNVPLPEPGPSSSFNQAPPAPPTAQNTPADDQQVLYLIALRDHTILPAVAYWVQGDTLNYITVQGAQNRISLALVDRDFSRQLNTERNLPFRLPPAQ